LFGSAVMLLMLLMLLMLRSGGSCMGPRLGVNWGSFTRTHHKLCDNSYLVRLDKYSVRTPSSEMLTNVALLPTILRNVGFNKSHTA
jgi:hypothetical protein